MPSRRARYEALVPLLLLASPAYVPLGRSLLRLVPAGLLLPAASNAQEGQAAGAGENTIKVGSAFKVSYPGAIPRDDFYLSSTEAEFGNQALTNPKVLYVKKGSRAYAQGLRVGDELDLAYKEDVYGFYSEGQLRRMRNVDGVLKKAANSTTFIGMEAPPGINMEFVALGVAQPGDPAPDFKLPASSGGELSLAELLKDNEYLVVFFRPGSRFRGGDLQEVRLFGKAARALAERGATAVGIQMEPVAALARQAASLELPFPLLCDYDGSVAKAYGTYLELEEQGPNIDRKTFIIGNDGQVKTAFVNIGYDADKTQLTNHVAEVVRVLGGNPNKAKDDMKTKSKSLGDLVDIATGKKAPAMRSR